MWRRPVRVEHHKHLETRIWWQQQLSFAGDLFVQNLQSVSDYERYGHSSQHREPVCEGSHTWVSSGPM